LISLPLGRPAADGAPSMGRPAVRRNRLVRLWGRPRRAAKRKGRPQAALLVSNAG